MKNSTFLNKSQKLNSSGKKMVTRLIFAICFVIAGLSVSNAFAKNVTIQWDTNDDADYYVVYWGNSSGNYSQHSDDIDAPATQYTAVDISDSGTWYFAVKAYNSCGNSSDFSDEVISSGSSEFLCSISSPASEQSVIEGATLNIQGNASGGDGSLIYLWDFGGSGVASSMVEDPGNVTFSISGTYTVTFTVTDEDGDIVSDTVTIDVVSDGTPSASISNPASEQSIMAGSTVDFQGNASGGNGSLSYLWNFGGSGAVSSSLEDPGSVIFSNSGSYTITFTTTDSDGDSDSDSVVIHVASDATPSASISSPSTEQSIMAGAAVNFQGNASGGNGSLNYLWDFGGSGTGSRSVEDPGNIIFSNAGTFTVTFTVTDDDGDVVSDTVKVNVASDTTPSATISSPSSEQSIMAGTSLNFQGTASGGNGTLDYLWDFGGSGTGSRSVEDPGTIIFSNAGTFTVAFSVTDDDGDVVSDTVKVNVASDTIPSATISSPSSEQSIMAGTSLNFQGTASGGNGSLNYLWDFGGSGTGSRSIEDPGTIIFSNAGSFIVTFTVTDDDGDVVADTVKVNVASDTIPSAIISSPSIEQSIMAGTSVNFQGTASGGNGSLNYLWDFGGSGADSRSIEDPGNVIFSNAGTFTVTFTVTDDDGDVVSDTVKVNVASDAIPTAIISSPSTEQSIMVGTSVNFQGNTSGGNGLLSFSWDFDGGFASSIAEDPGSVIFSSAGTYEVSFTVTDSDGDSVTDTVLINVASDTIPSASIMSPLSEQSIMAGAFVNFQSNASGGNGPLTYSWDFDGGAVSKSIEDPGNVIFSSAGTYEVAFIVTDSDGDVASDTIMINVASDSIPSASILSPSSDQAIMADTVVNFQGAASGGNAPLTYSWDFEGGAAQSIVEDPGGVTFSDAGTYLVTFSVTDSDGDIASDTVVINVENDTVPFVEITKPVTEQSIMTGEMIDFQGDVSGGNAPLLYLWDFDGGPVQRSVEDPGSVIFSSAGAYEVTFKVTDSNGDVVSDKVTVMVTEPDTPDTGGTELGQPEPVYPNDDTNVSLTPELQADISEQNGQSRWQISKFPDFSSIMVDITKKSELSFLKVPMLVLNGKTKYYWRVKLNDTKGEPSAWSTTTAFSTTGEVAPDSDSNGIPDSQEIDETIDLDFDGTADIDQDDIKCVRSIVEGKQIIGVKKGRKVSGIELVESIDHRDIKDTSGMPDDMPSGLIGFKIEVENPGDTAEVTVCFSVPAPANAGWYKYDSINGWVNYTSHVLFSSDRMSVSITLTDGGTGDADGTKNGVIVDPGGLGIMDTQAPVIFSELAEESGCFIGSTGTLNGLTSGNSFFIFIFKIWVCFGVMMFVRKFY